MNRAIPLLLVPLAVACQNPTAPAAVAAQPVANSSILLTTACDSASVWDFVVDGRPINKRGDLWFLPDTGSVTVAVDTAIAVHTIDATRWSPSIGETRDTVRSGRVYALACH